MVCYYLIVLQSFSYETKSYHENSKDENKQCHIYTSLVRKEGQEMSEEEGGFAMWGALAGCYGTRVWVHSGGQDSDRHRGPQH